MSQPADGLNPSELHQQAHREHRGDHVAARARYIELMTEAGYLVPREQGDDSPLLPCGWNPRTNRDVDD